MNFIESLGLQVTSDMLVIGGLVVIALIVWIAREAWRAWREGDEKDPWAPNSEHHGTWGDNE